jgi:hypothetical protein
VNTDSVSLGPEAAANDQLVDVLCTPSAAASREGRILLRVSLQRPPQSFSRAAKLSYACSATVVPFHGRRKPARWQRRREEWAISTGSSQLALLCLPSADPPRTSVAHKSAHHDLNQN